MVANGGLLQERFFLAGASECTRVVANGGLLQERFFLSFSLLWSFVWSVGYCGDSVKFDFPSLPTVMDSCGERGCG